MHHIFHFQTDSLKHDTNIPYHKWSQIIPYISTKMTNEIVKYSDDNKNIPFHQWSQIIP